MGLAQEVTHEILTLQQLKSILLNLAPRFINATLIMLIGIVISRLLRRWLRAALNRTRVRDDPMIREFFLKSLSLAILFLAAMTALDQLGFNVTSFAAGLGVTTLIVGFALRDMLSNIASGLLLLIYRPFRAGDLIEVEGANGVVEELTVVNTQMTTVDGVRVVMPNSKVWAAKITNYSVSQRRRLEFSVKIKRIDVEHAIKAVAAALTADSRVLRIPNPTVRVSGVEGETATLVIWLWTNPEDFDGVSRDGYLNLLRGLREVEIPAAESTT